MAKKTGKKTTKKKTSKKTAKKTAKKTTKKTAKKGAKEKDAPEAAEFINMRGQLTTQQQGSVKKMFHTIVNPIGRFCTRCHVAEEGEGYLPFRDLGFSDARASALTNLNIAGLVQKYKEFYMELVFLGKEDDEATRALVGDAPDLEEEMDDKMKDDPRGWWRQDIDD